MSVEIQALQGSKWLVLINGEALSFYCASLQDAMTIAQNAFSDTVEG